MTMPPADEAAVIHTDVTPADLRPPSPGPFDVAVPPDGLAERPLPEQLVVLTEIHDELAAALAATED